MATALHIDTADWRVFSDDVPGVTVFEGKPGPACGHFVDASSYFDR
jgi:hypothetical protein